MDHPSRGPWLWRAVRLLAAFGFFAYFLWFTIDGLSSWFSDDDLMNLHNSLARIVLNDTRDDFYFRPLPAIELALQNAGIGSDLDRPMGLAFYRILYAGWGFTALPFRVAALLLLCANLWLLFQVGRRISGSRETAWLAMILTGFHASFASLYFDTGMIYDVLAFFFYFGALWLYLRSRETGAEPSPWRMAQVLILFVAAMNAKQIAITLPIAVLLWEATRERPYGWRWLWGPGRTGVLALALAAAYAGRQFFGNELMRSHVGYRPDVSATAYLASAAKYLSQWTYGAVEPGAAGMAGLLIVLLGITVLLRRPPLVWAAGMILVAILPLAFIPPRGGYAFYVPAVFWALWLAGFAVELRRMAVSWLSRWVPHAALASQIVLLAGAAVWLLPMHARLVRYPLAAIHAVQAANHRYHDQLLGVLPRLPRGAKVLVRNDPYPAGGFDASFLVRLTYEDMTIAVDRARFPWLAKRQFNSQDYDAALDFVDGRFVLIPRP